MLESLPEQAPDKIIELMGLYAADPRAEKIDLGVGVYKDATGKTPVMRAVKAAERRLLDEQDSKSYVGLRGDLAFVDAMREMVLGEAVAPSRVVGAQTPGGTGAVRQLYHLLKLANPQATLWMSDPTWPNHPAMAKAADLEFRTYRYLRKDRPEVDFAAMMEDLGAAKAGDAVLLHGCCHNPTGANLTDAEWTEITDMVLERGLVPFIDFAYQGFGDGLDADASGVRLMAGRVPEMVIAASCSKNFGVYRDRVGVMLAITTDAATGLVGGAMASLNRLAYSFPPDHGAKVVGTILADPALLADWKAELEDMRLGMLQLREGLAEALRQATNSDRFDFVARHRGMFSRLGLTPEQVTRLREDHGVYMVGDSRINVAGLRAEIIERLARAIASVL